MAMAFTPDTTDAGPDVAEFPTYMADRQAKGFTTLQIVAATPTSPNASTKAAQPCCLTSDCKMVF